MIAWIKAIAESEASDYWILVWEFGAAIHMVVSIVSLESGGSIYCTLAWAFGAATQMVLSIIILWYQDRISRRALAKDATEPSA